MSWININKYRRLWCSCWMPCLWHSMTKSGPSRWWLLHRKLRPVPKRPCWARLPRWKSPWAPFRRRPPAQMKLLFYSGSRSWSPRWSKVMKPTNPPRLIARNHSQDPIDVIPLLNTPSDHDALQDDCGSDDDSESEDDEFMTTPGGKNCFFDDIWWYKVFECIVKLFWCFFVKLIDASNMIFNHLPNPDPILCNTFNPLACTINWSKVAISADALRMRARRMCEVKPSGRSHVDAEIVSEYKSGGSKREVLEMALLELPGKNTARVAMPTNVSELHDYILASCYSGACYLYINWTDDQPINYRYTNDREKKNPCLNLFVLDLCDPP